MSMAMSNQSKNNDVQIKHLLRQVGYMFYPHQCIIILEVLLFHTVLFEEDLLKLCCMHKKLFRSFCNRLLEDRLIVAHIQKEEAQQFRLFTRTYYYIHNIEAIDSIKWKIHSIVKQVKEEIGNFSEPQGYICPTCHHRYTLLDAASLLTDDKMNFECSICGDYLIEDDLSKEQKKGQEKLERLMSQLEPIIESLKTIDSMKIEDNNFESALIRAIPATSNSLALYSVSNKTSASKRRHDDNLNHSGIQDATKRSQATINVSITADDEDLRRERLKREERNQKLRQNALPSWHQESTVGKEALGKLKIEEDVNNINDNSGDFTDGSEFKIKLQNNEINETPKSQDTAMTDFTQDSALTENSNTTSTTTTTSNNISTILRDSETVSGSGSVSGSVLAAATNPNTNLEVMSNKNSDVNNNNNKNNSSSNSSNTAEELDALTAYYAQLRQRQEEEEEAEEEDDEEDDEDEINGNAFNDIDDEEFDGFDEPDEAENKGKEVLKEKVKETDTPKVKDEKHIQKEEKPSVNDAEEDEEDFDMDMFESDAE